MMKPQMAAIWIAKKYGAECVTADGGLTAQGLAHLEAALSSMRAPMPWDCEMMVTSTEQSLSKAYTMFPITDPLAWKFYCQQVAQMWNANEVKFADDRRQFASLSPRYRELVGDLLGFFAPGDGLVSMQVLRYIKECTTYAQMMFLIAQLFIEAVHSEGYGMAIVSLFEDPVEQKAIFDSVDELPCVKAKAAFILKYNNSDLSAGLRYIAGAASEGVFFVGLFAIIFALRTKGIMKAFVFLNEQVSKDETLHRDFNAAQARVLGGFTYEEAVAVLTEAVDIEVAHLSYILRHPLDTAEADAAMGLTIDNLTLFVKGLADQILVLAGLPTHFKVSMELPWMRDLALGKKTNFYEGTVADYKHHSVGTSIDWRTRAGLDDAAPVNAVANPDDVEF